MPAYPDTVGRWPIAWCMLVILHELGGDHQQPHSERSSASPPPFLFHMTNVLIDLAYDTSTESTTLTHTHTGMNEVQNTIQDCDLRNLVSHLNQNGIYSRHENLPHDHNPKLPSSQLLLLHVYLAFGSCFLFCFNFLFLDTCGSAPRQRSADIGCMITTFGVRLKLCQYLR